jgi:uncharacterized membrane protein
MTKRMLAALVALVGLFISIYLTLYKFGVIGTLTCSVGSCETVQTSRWATLLGLPVAAWGVGFYLSVLALTFVGTHDRFAESRAISIALVAITGWGVVFSAWLTYLEAAVIDAWCQWCVVSAVLTLVLFVLSLLDWRELRREAGGGGREE